MKAPNLFIFLLSTLLANAKPPAIELTTFRDYSEQPPKKKQPKSTYPRQQQPDLRDPFVLLDYLEDVARYTRRNGKVPEGTVPTLMNFLQYGCNWPILPGLILATTREGSPTRVKLWDQGQLALKTAQQRQRTERLAREQKALTARQNQQQAG